ncbi:MAG: DUF302 domain-containing protein [Candidatus Solibacter sp.]|nr:DUF302 domain-containing protein [Candidatus Solibacter sp.]
MQTGKTIEYGYVREVALEFEEAVAKIEAALKTEGFGVLCQIDIQVKLKEKLGVEFPKYLILGACNPPIAYQALQQEINLGLLLPCNAVVYQQDGRIYVGVVDAAKMLSVVGNPAMEAMARQVNEKLRRAVDRVAAPVAA